MTRTRASPSLDRVAAAAARSSTSRRAAARAGRTQDRAHGDAMRASDVVLDQPYAAVRRNAVRTQPYASSADEVKRDFGAALAAQPRARRRFTLLLRRGHATSSPTNRTRELDAALRRDRGAPGARRARRRPHRPVGSDPLNDALARQRADTVRAELIRRGVAADDVQAIRARQARADRADAPTASPSRATGASRSSSADAVATRRLRTHRALGAIRRSIARQDRDVVGRLRAGRERERRRRAARRRGPAPLPRLLPPPRRASPRARARP